MSVAELIESLRTLPADSKVVVSMGGGYGLQEALEAVPLRIEQWGRPMEYRAVGQPTGENDGQKVAVHIVGRF